jgi:hypothetical protein
MTGDRVQLSSVGRGVGYPDSESRIFNTHVPAESTSRVHQQSGDGPNSSASAAAGLHSGFSFATSDHRNLLSLSLSTVR